MLHRRDALRLGLKSLGLLAVGPRLLACASEPVIPGLLVSNLANVGPLGPPDRNGVRLPEGFTSRIVAFSGEPVLGEGSYVWHHAPDGGACFKTPDGGWIYVSNAELSDGQGGVGALRFNKDGDIIDAYSILSGTHRNCAGGPTPWNTWLSCEETPAGLVYECDPFGGEAQLRSALGVFRHEAVCIDPIGGQLYLTEDREDGRFYRFTPDNGLPDLSSGVLEVLEVIDGEEGAVRWLPVPDPTASTVDTRHQVPESTAFTGGEGIWFHVGVVYFSTKGDNRVWALHASEQRLSIVYDDDHFSPATLTGVDNLTSVQPGAGADVLVTEDAGDMQIVALTSGGGVVPLLQVVEQAGSEVTGPAFDPSGQRLYFSSQRGELISGFTYEITGPFLVPA